MLAEPMLLRANIGARQAEVIPVVVGGPQDTFNPDSVTAAVRDIIQFQFINGNHTTTQSSLEAPCTPLGGGINSGHIPFQDGQTTVGTFNMVVSNADPIFMFWLVTHPPTSLSRGAQADLP
ncbi:hypothetical protein PMIN06_002835 [Paraphaeosphaeria minitans]